MSKYDRLSATVQNDPWDTESWNLLLADVLSKGDPIEIRSTYDSLLKTFPSSVNPFTPTSNPV
jgi:hypothetical protein